MHEYAPLEDLAWEMENVLVLGSVFVYALIRRISNILIKNNYSSSDGEVFAQEDTAISVGVTELG